MQLGFGLGLTSALPFGTAALDPDAAIAALFQTETPGVYHEGAWYDPSDLSTVFQDAAGTTPAGVGDPVGLILDKSKGLVLGAELFSDFETEGLWTDNGDGSWSITNAASNTDLRSATLGVTGKRYVVSITFSNVSGTLTFYPLNTSPKAVTSDGTYVIRQEANGGVISNGLWIRATTGASATVSNISVKELPGNHATQTTSAARPILQQSGATAVTSGPELEDTANTVAGWTTLGSNPVELDGDAIKVTFVDNSSGAQITLTEAGVLTTNLTAGRTYRFTAQAKVNTGAVNTSIISAATFPTQTVTWTDFDTVTLDFVADGSNETFRFGAMATGEVIWIKNISVKEVTSWVGGLRYLDFDGVDDWMQSAAGIDSGIDLYTSSALRIDGAGGGSSAHPITSPGLTGSTASFCAMIRNDVVRRLIGFYRLGSTVSFYTPNLENSYTHGVPFIMRSWHESDTLYAETNEAASVSVAAVESIPVTTRQITLVGSSTSFLAAKYFGGVLVADRVLTAQEKSDLESYLADKSGVTL